MDSTRDRLMQMLVETRSFIFSPTPSIPLASGKMSRYYVDCKVGLSYPEMRRIVGDLIFERIERESIHAVGGLVIGAYPIAIAVSDAAYRSTGRILRAFVVRKEPKPHGMRKLVEGAVTEGDRVVIVDDVITSGQSTIDAIKRSRQEGLEVVRAVAIIDREEQDGRNRIEAEGVPFESLCTLRELQSLSESVAHKEK